jgi:hypothetical protein
MTKPRVSTMIGMATIGDTMEHSLVGGGTERTNPCDGVQNGVGRPGSVSGRLNGLVRKFVGVRPRGGVLGR